MKIDFTRPLKQVVEDKATVLGAIAKDSADGFNLNLTAEAAGNTRLLARLKLTPEVNGSQCRFKLSFLGFSASASELYLLNDETPFSDEEADSVVVLGNTPWSDLDELHNAAGEEASR